MSAKLVYKFRDHKQNCRNVLWTPDGKFLISSSGSKLYTSEKSAEANGFLIRDFNPFLPERFSLSSPHFSSSSSSAAAVSSSGEKDSNNDNNNVSSPSSLDETQSPCEIGKIKYKLPVSVCTGKPIALSSCGRYLACADLQFRIVIFDIESKFKIVTKLDSNILSQQQNQYNQQQAAAQPAIMNNRLVNFFRRNNSKKKNQEKTIEAIDFNPKNSLEVACCGQSQRAYIYSFDPHHQQHQPEQQVQEEEEDGNNNNIGWNSNDKIKFQFTSKRQYRCIKYRPDGHQLVLGDSRGNIDIADTHTGIILAKIQQTDEKFQWSFFNVFYFVWMNDAVHALWTSDGKFLIVGYADHTIRKIDTATRQCVFVLDIGTRPHGFDIYADSVLAVATQDNRVRIFLLSSGVEKVYDPELENLSHESFFDWQTAQKPAFHPKNPDMLAVACSDGTVQVFSLGAAWKSRGGIFKIQKFGKTEMREALELFRVRGLVAQFIPVNFEHDDNDSNNSESDGSNNNNNNNTQEKQHHHLQPYVSRQITFKAPRPGGINAIPVLSNKNNFGRQRVLIFCHNLFMWTIMFLLVAGIWFVFWYSTKYSWKLMWMFYDNTVKYFFGLLLPKPILSLMSYLPFSSWFFPSPDNNNNNNLVSDVSSTLWNNISVTPTATE